MGPLLFLFIVVPALELAVMIQVGTLIGAANTLVIILATGALGAGLARWEGVRVLRKIQAQIHQGVLPSAELMDGLMILLGGVLLLTPGFITDIVGVLLLVPWTRALARGLLARHWQAVIQSGRWTRTGPVSRGESPYEDIDI